MTKISSERSQMTRGWHSYLASTGNATEHLSRLVDVMPLYVVNVLPFVKNKK